MKFYPTKEQAFKLAENEEFKSIPLTLTEPCHISETEIYQILKNISHNVFILDSAEKNTTNGRYTFLGFDPSLELTCRNGKVRLRSGTDLTFENADPKYYIRKILSENKSPKLAELPPFTGGLVGYFAFDFIKYSEPHLKFDILD